MLTALARWTDRNILALGREMRLSYLPPLMVYMAVGISGLTGIVGTFFVKEYLSLSAEFLAAIAFWAVIPWSLKMVFGHIVDLIWRWKEALVYLGAALMAASLLIMVGLIGHREAMSAVMPVSAWFVLSEILMPIGFVIQDSVADAMTVEAVPRYDRDGTLIEPGERKLMHTTMQTLGRVAIIGGGVLVSVINLWLFTGVETLPQQQIAEIYEHVYLMALVVPIISVLGVVSASFIQRRERKRLRAQGLNPDEIDAQFSEPDEAPSPNWWILGGGLLFVIFTIAVGLSRSLSKMVAGEDALARALEAISRYNEEIVFAGSFAIVVFLITRLTRVLDAEARATLIGTAVIIFVFRATPVAGPGVSWWMIDELKFDQHFFSILSLITASLTLLGMFIFRRFMAERSIAYVVGFLTIAGFVLSLPIIAMYHGFHEWTAAHTGGVIDARSIALVDTALASPLGQISMIPMLAWIANSAPANLKATFFAVMASFTNLALSMSQLGGKYLNQAYVVTREVKTPSGAIGTPADYSQLGDLLLVQLVIGVVLPFAAIAIARGFRFRSA